MNLILELEQFDALLGDLKLLDFARDGDWKVLSEMDVPWNLEM